MISFEQLYSQAQSITADDDATTLALLKPWINEGARKCYSVLNSELFLDEYADATEDSVYSYTLPPLCEKMHTITVTVSDVAYPVLEWCGTEEQWNILTDGSSSTESDYPQWFFMKKDTVEFYPTPADDDDVITYKYKTSLKDMSADDHTTESIKTAVVGSTAIVGNTSSAFTSAMAGRYLKVTADGVWYRIASVTNGTTLVLAREWAGTAITAGTSAYIIGEMSRIPEDFQESPLNYCLYRYYLQKENTSLATTYKALFDENLKEIKRLSNDTTSGIIDGEVVTRNPNDFPSGLS